MSNVYMLQTKENKEILYTVKELIESIRKIKNDDFEIKWKKSSGEYSTMFAKQNGVIIKANTYALGKTLTKFLKITDKVISDIEKREQENRNKIRDLMKVDIERALYLANYINTHNATQEMVKQAELELEKEEQYMFYKYDTSKLTAIKTKTSQSSWYNNSYIREMHMKSEYITFVPTEIKAAAQELQSIRRKYQNNYDFPFYETNYICLVLRDADHDFDRYSNIKIKNR